MYGKIRAVGFVGPDGDGLGFGGIKWIDGGATTARLELRVEEMCLERQGKEVWDVVDSAEGGGLRIF